jgi:hypothetical protein
MMMPHRSWSSESGYRFGFGGQEQDDEVAGNGNSYTAEFWQYDSRLGRRLNIDPRQNSSQGPYVVFNLNPTVFIDVHGDTTYLFQSGGKYLGQIDDNLENQVHFLDDRTAKQDILSAYKNAEHLTGPEYTNKLAESLRISSVAYMGRNTMLSMNSFGTEGYERGGILVISPSKEIIALEKTSKLFKEGAFNGIKDRASEFPGGNLEHITSRTERTILFGSFHTHPGNNFKPTNYSSSEWYSTPNYKEPDDYSGIFSRGATFNNDDGFRGGHMALVVTKDYISIYSTVVQKSIINYRGKSERQIEKNSMSSQGKYQHVTRNALK